MKTNKILTVAVILLLIINAIMLIVMVKGRGHRDMGKRGGGPGDMMVKELSMTEQQQTEFNKLRDEHFLAIRPVFDSVKTLKKSFFGLIKQENFNDSLVHSYSALISEQRALADRLTINHFRKVRAMFSGDQQKKFDDFVQKMMDRKGVQGGRRKDSTGKRR